MQWDDKSLIPLLSRRETPNEDATNWGYFEDERNPQEITMRMNSKREIKFTNPFYTLSSWVTWILEAGFQINQFVEPRVEPEAIPAHALAYTKFCCRKASGNVLGVHQTIVAIDEAGECLILVHVTVSNLGI